MNKDLSYEIEIKYDRKTIVNGAKVYCKLKYLNDMIISPLLLAIIIWGVLDSEINDILSGVALTVGIIYFLMVYVLGLYLPYKSANVWQTAGLKTGKWTFNKKELIISSEINEINYSWRNVKKLWITDKYWFFIYSTDSNSSLPISGVSNEIKSFIKEQVSIHGGKIINKS